MLFIATATLATMTPSWPNSKSIAQGYERVAQATGEAGTTLQKHLRAERLRERQLQREAAIESGFTIDDTRLISLKEKIGFDTAADVDRLARQKTDMQHMEDIAGMLNILFPAGSPRPSEKEINTAMGLLTEAASNEAQIGAVTGETYGDESARLEVGMTLKNEELREAFLKTVSPRKRLEFFISSAKRAPLASEIPSLLENVSMPDTERNRSRVQALIDTIYGREI